LGKASSPIRLERGLMDAAKTTGALSHRSSAEQIEYWADLGRKVSHVLSPDVILALKAGFATLSVEQVKAPELDVDDVFAGLKRDREDGTLSGKISAGNVRYQASKTHPGMLERVSPDGNVEVGQFADGNFKVLTHP
jgi:hypothetical protein